jgi:hypothetical protein
VRRRALKKRYGHGVAAYNRGSRLISRQTDAAIAGRVKLGRYCMGKMYNGPGKRFARCGRCGHIDYEANEGDKCGRIIA